MFKFIRYCKEIIEFLSFFLFGIKRGYDYICDVNKFRNEVDKIGYGLFDIVWYLNL